MSEVSRGRVGSAALLGVLALVYFLPTASNGFEVRDEGYFLALTRRAAEGELPNRDFVDIYGPALYLLNGFLLRAFDMQVLAVRWSIAIVKALAVAGVFVASTAVAPRAIAVLASLFAIAALGRNVWNLNAPYAALYVAALGVWSLVCMLRGRETRRLRWWFLAGLLAGAAVPFKQSLAAMNAVGLILMALCSALLEPATYQARRTKNVWRLLFVAVLVVPFAAHVPFGLVDARGFLLFLAPAQCLGLIVLIASVRAPPQSKGAEIATGLLALAAGGLVPPLLLISFYAWHEAAGALLSTFLTGPGLYSDYSEALALPAPATLAWLAAVVLAVTGAIRLLEERSREALAWGAASAILVAVALMTGGSFGSFADVLVAGNQVATALPVLCSYVLLAVCGTALLRGGPWPGWLLPTLYVSFWHHAMTFEVFPRAGFNVVQGLGAFLPGLAAVLAAWWRALDVEKVIGWRRACSLGLTALPCLWIFSTALGTGPLGATGPEVSLPFVETRGIGAKRGSSEASPDLSGIVEFVSSQPEGRPIFQMNNDWAILFFSGRRPMFAGDELRFYLMLWDMLDRTKLAPGDEEHMVELLSSAPDPLILVKEDASTRSLRRYLPRLAAYVDREFATVREFGPYRALERR